MDANDNIIVTATDRATSATDRIGTSKHITITNDTAHSSEDFGERNGGDRLALMVHLWPDEIVDKEATPSTLHPSSPNDTPFRRKDCKEII